MRKSLYKAVFGLVNEENEIHAFDFDDTLGVTSSPTIHMAVMYNGGDPEDPSSFQPITDLVTRLQGSVSGAVQKPSQNDVVKGMNVDDTIDDLGDPFNGAQVAVTDTAQYRDWKEKYLPSVAGSRIVVGGDLLGKLKDAARKRSGKPGEIHVVDFSPSFTLGNVKPIDPTIQLLGDEESGGAFTAVITARKGKTDLDTIKGTKQPARNASDIRDFLASKGAEPDLVMGAADISNDTADNKRKILKSLTLSKGASDVNFYDDDPENVKAVAKMCTDDDLRRKVRKRGKPVDLKLYNKHFDRSSTVGDPSQECRIEESHRWMVLAGILKG